MCVIFTTLQKFCLCSWMWVLQNPQKIYFQKNHAFIVDDSMLHAFATHSKLFYSCLCKVNGGIAFKDLYRFSPRETFKIGNMVCCC
jgi:hypothetical protein